MILVHLRPVRHARVDGGERALPAHDGSRVPRPHAPDGRPTVQGHAGACFNPCFNAQSAKSMLLRRSHGSSACTKLIIFIAASDASFSHSRYSALTM